MVVIVISRGGGGSREDMLVEPLSRSEEGGFLASNACLLGLGVMERKKRKGVPKEIYNANRCGRMHQSGAQELARGRG